MNVCLLVPLVLLGCFSLAVAGADDAQRVRESARRIPIAAEADVVVVGGSTGAVSAAVAAAQKGASVFLAAPHTYLGEDLCATLRLWLEPGEAPSSPLAKALFAGSRRPDALPSLPFTYAADLPSVAPHRDTAPPSLLSDGSCANPQRESVQYDGDVTLTADLGKRQRIDDAHLLVYHRKDFQVARVTVSTSNDGRRWREAVEVQNPHPPQKDLSAPALDLSAAIAADARYLRFHVVRAEGSTRLLIGEIAITGPRKLPPAKARHGLVTPLHVKRTLDKALLDAGVRFLFGCVATDVLTDADGRPCGIVMANRAGRQAVVAKVIIDTTRRACVARMAGARSRPWPAGSHTFRRVVIGGEPRSAEAIAAQSTGLAFTARGTRHDLIDYALTLPVADGRHASLAEAEQRARDLTATNDAVRGAELLFCVPPDPIIGRANATGTWKGADGLPLACFQPAGIDRVFVLGGCADVPRDHAERLLRPLALIGAGRRIGEAAAAEAASLPQPRQPQLAATQVAAAPLGDVREPLAGVRPAGRPATVPAGDRALPVLATCDVVVAGGGTSGAPAAIAAARRGARTLVVEVQHALGGVGTLGLIGRYHRGFRGGFTSEVDKATGAGSGGWSVERKADWWRRTLRGAGARVWFGTIACGALVHEGTVRGLVVATPQGRGVVLAKAVIDATGNADVAAAAGAPCVTTDATTVAVQGTGLPIRELGANYTNTDFAVTDETDVVDVWQLFVYARRRYRGGFDIGTLVDTRERRRVVGDFTLSLLDTVNGRTYPDTIAQAISNLDTHGFTIAPYLYLRHPTRVHCYVPYRAILPKGLDGLFVVGLGLSAHRDAMPFVRMQADLQNLGYAAGVAAAMAAASSATTRTIDLEALQKHLVDIGNLPDAVLAHDDSYPMPQATLERAVRSLPDDYRGAAALLAHPKQAIPLLRDAWKSAATEARRLAYGHVLAILGDATGIDTLIAAVDASPDLGDGYEYRGMGHDHSRRRMSQVDSLIFALGCTRDRRATSAILPKLALLGPKLPFSHHHAIARALEQLRDPAAAEPLARLLAKPGMSGHSIQTLDDALRAEKPPLGNASRLLSFREIVLARALLRCGDHDAAARTILEAYRTDLRGHFARHAAAVLAEAQ